jgi:hypothetical protein
MFPDAREMDARARALHRLPWCIPASVVMEIYDAELDALADADDADYWHTLNRIVGRITGGDDE